MQHRPDVILGGLPLRDSLAGGAFHDCDGAFAGVTGAAHGIDFIGAFDCTGFLGQFLARQHGETLGFQSAQALDHHLVDAKPHICAAVLADQVGHFAAEFIRRWGHFIAPVEIEQVGPGSLFAHKRIELAQEHAVLVIPDHHVSVCADQHRPECVMGIPQLHIGAVGGVADVQRVEHQDTAVVPRIHRSRQPGVAKRPHPGQVGQGQPGGGPFGIGKLGGADFHPVIVIGRSIGKGCAARRVDLAGVTKMSVHAGAPFGHGAGAWAGCRV